MRKNQARWWEQIPQARYTGRLLSLGERRSMCSGLYLEPLSRLLAWLAIAGDDPRAFIIERTVILVAAPIPIEYTCHLEY